MSIDHGPLFHSDADLGYTMYPGGYRITEKRSGLIHRFSLTVNDLGRRVTSYQTSGGGVGIGNKAAEAVTDSNTGKASRDCLTAKV